MFMFEGIVLFALLCLCGCRVNTHDGEVRHGRRNTVEARSVGCKHAARARERAGPRTWTWWLIDEVYEAATSAADAMMCG